MLMCGNDFLSQIPLQDVDQRPRNCDIDLLSYDTHGQANPLLPSVASRTQRVLWCLAWGTREARSNLRQSASSSADAKFDAAITNPFGRECSSSCISEITMRPSSPTSIGSPRRFPIASISSKSSTDGVRSAKRKTGLRWVAVSPKSFRRSGRRIEPNSTGFEDCVPEPSQLASFRIREDRKRSNCCDGLSRVSAICRGLSTPRPNPLEPCELSDTAQP